MKLLDLQHRLRRVVTDTALPSLRVIGMAYTGLIGVFGVSLVVSVAFLPVPPVLQEATQPAREAVSSLVQPATDAVASIISTQLAPRGPSFLFLPSPIVAASSAVADPVAADESPADQPVAEEAPAQPARIVVAAAILRGPPVAVAEPDPVVEDVPIDAPEQPVEVVDRAPVQPLAEALPEAPVLQAANVEPPRPLPPVPTPTETPRQTRARLDVENQAAIDAARAALVRRKAEADTANQAAIDAQKGAAANVAGATPHQTEPVATPQSAPAAQSAAAGPTTPISAKTAALRARADANAANQVAIDAARAPKSPVKPTQIPTAQPAPAVQVGSPPTVAEPASVSPQVEANDAGSVEGAVDQPSSPVKGVVVRISDLDEAPIMLAEDEQQP